MSFNTETLNEIFTELAEAVGITEPMAEAAERSYKSVGRHLDEDESLGETEVYPQGSFAIGTATRPVSGEDSDYDIDLVCELKEASQRSARYVKMSVGDSLESYRKDAEEEGKRCWTFQYDRFHMDVLPCTPDLAFCEESTAIRLTHKNPDGTYSDRFSNPKGYRDWFTAKAGEPRKARRAAVSNRMRCSLEDVPEYAVKSPLQQAVQIIKHHRDVMFENRDDAPISIILTTLATKAYRGEMGVFDTVRGILPRMAQLVELRDGEYWVENPVDEYENFAEKWNDEPQKARAFYEWVDAARADLVEGPMGAIGLDKLKEVIAGSMGDRQASDALKSFGKGIKAKGESGKLFASATGISLTAAEDAKAIPNHTFFGA